MKTRLSIENVCFRGLRAAFDNALEGTIQKMLEIRAGECSVGMKLSIEMVGVDAEERKVPHIKYKISTGIPIKGDYSATLADWILLEKTPDGLMCIQEGEQTSMLDD